MSNRLNTRFVDKSSPHIKVLEIYHGITEEAGAKGNVDVRVDLSDGRSFAATFFTVKNLILLMEQFRNSGECANGTYVWAKDMIVVDSISEDVIRRSIADLIETKEIESACTRIA